MRPRPSRLRRLDDALADLPLEEPMLLTELDGFLTGIVLSPVSVMPTEWMRNIWGAEDGDVAPFEDPLDVQWFADAVMARYDEIVRDLGRGKPQPIFDIDERNGDVLWEPWIDWFAEAVDLRPDAWAAMAGSKNAGDAYARMTTLIAVAREESDLDSIAINALQDRARADIVEDLRRLHVARVEAGAGTVAANSTPLGKIGRNDPCRCGSGRKSKRCCG